MVCWKITDISCIIEVFVCFSFFVVGAVNVSVTVEHAIFIYRLTVIHITILIDLTWWLIPSHEVRIYLLVWIYSISLVVLLMTILVLVHVIIHTSHVMSFHVMWSIVWNLAIIWLLLSLWLIFMWLLVITFSVHLS